MSALRVPYSEMGENENKGFPLFGVNQNPMYIVQRSCGSNCAECFPTFYRNLNLNAVANGIDCINQTYFS